MIAGIFHAGSGLGNQLHRYVATRVLAEDKGYEWGMLDPELFKGFDFMKIDTGLPTNAIRKYMNFWNEKKVVENGVDIRSYDPEFNFVQDNTIIDGEFQDPRYFEHRMSDIDKWLTVEPMVFPDDVCVIGFRGGEYQSNPDLFLPKEYWESATTLMREKYPGIRFEVHTDDPTTARYFFPIYPIIHDIGINWRSMRYAKHAIIANSSFYILPRLLSGGVTIAPRYWARRNIGVWSMAQNYYKSFIYL